MNDLAQAIMLGVVQGLTEFLPVSSSGHLVLAQQALGDRFQFAHSTVLFDLVLHAGTLLPVLWFYRADLVRMVAACWPFPAAGSLFAAAQASTHPAPTPEDRGLVAHVLLGSVPTALIGVLFKDSFEALFHNVTAVCIALLVTGGLLLATRASRKDNGRGGRITARNALIIGLVQGMAITPGISRSGSTIAAALLLGTSREEAARFSFLLSIPAICGAILFMLKDGVPLDGASLPALAAGFLAALVVGYGALIMLVALVRKGGLYRFTFYVWPVAVIAWVLLR